MLRTEAEWHRAVGASDAELDVLRLVAPQRTPASLYALLSYSNGGEGPLPVRPLHFVLDDAATIAAFEETRPYGDILDGFLVIGSNGGGEFIAIDLRDPSASPVIAMDMVAGPESAMQIADDLDAFIVLVGFDS